MFVRATFSLCLAVGHSTACLEKPKTATRCLIFYGLHDTGSCSSAFSQTTQKLKKKKKYNIHQKCAHIKNTVCQATIKKKTPCRKSNQSSAGAQTKTSNSPVALQHFHGRGRTPHATQKSNLQPLPEKTRASPPPSPCTILGLSTQKRLHRYYNTWYIKTNHIRFMQ